MSLKAAAAEYVIKSQNKLFKEYAIKGTVMHFKKELINDRLRVLKVS